MTERVDHLIEGSGNKIRWKLSGAEAIRFGEVHTAKIAMVDTEDEEVGVYPEYGIDLIPFDQIYAIYDKNDNLIWSIL